MRILAAPFAAMAVLASPAQAQDAAPVTPEARAALSEFSRCVVSRSPAKAHTVLTRDFTRSTYRDEIRALARVNWDCLETWEGLRAYRKVELRASGLPFAAAMAETMLARSATPLNARLARAAKTEPPSFSPSDKAMICTARSDPDGAAKLLTAAGAEAEAAAAAALAPVVRACGAGAAIALTPYALRSVLATASYRLLDTAGALQ